MKWHMIELDWVQVDLKKRKTFEARSEYLRDHYPCLLLFSLDRFGHIEDRELTMDWYG